MKRIYYILFYSLALSVVFFFFKNRLEVNQKWCCNFTKTTINAQLTYVFSGKYYFVFSIRSGKPNQRFQFVKDDILTTSGNVDKLLEKIVEGDFLKKKVNSNQIEIIKKNNETFTFKLKKDCCD